MRAIMDLILKILGVISAALLIPSCLGFVASGGTIAQTGPEAPPNWLIFWLALFPIVLIVNAICCRILDGEWP